MNAESQFEAYLRQFEPRRPGPLPVSVETTPPWRRLAAAAVVLISIGFSAFVIVYKKESGEVRKLSERARGSFQGKFGYGRLSPISLTHLALEDPARLDAVLTDASRQTLPDFRSKNSTLRVLAKN
jgi:hypothetical protein